jgi:hypothetical protein
MKKAFVIIISVLSFVSVTKAQCVLPYKPLSDFSNDTTAFMKYNFTDRAICYCKTTVENVLQDLKFPIKSFTPIIDGLRDDIYTGAYIYFYSHETVEFLDEKNKNSNIMYVEFEKPILVSTFDQLRDKKDLNLWTDEISKFLKNQLITEVGLVQPDPIPQKHSNRQKRYTKKRSK